MTSSLHTSPQILRISSSWLMNGFPLKIKVHNIITQYINNQNKNIIYTCDGGTTVIFLKL